MEKIRLQKILANAGLFSRRKAEEAMTEGRVTVNGEVVTELGSRADPDKDVIVCDGARIEPQGKFYLIMNKPAGVICSCADDRGRKTVIDLVAEEMAKRVFPIGRLDYNTTGLLLLTNDGDFSQKLSHPSHGVVKTYMAKVRGVVAPETIKKMIGGITIEGEKYRFHNVRVDHVTGKNSVLMVELTEGKNLIIKILCQALGHPVAKLARVAYGPLKLGNLGLGDYRHLDRDEVKALLAAAKAKPKPKFIPLEQHKAAPERKTPPRKDFAGRNRPFAPPRRDAAERDRPFAPPRRGGFETRPYSPPERDRPFAPPRRDSAERGRPFAPPRRDAAERGRPFAPPRRDDASRDRPFAPPRRESAERGRPFAPPRRDDASRDRPFAPPRRDAAERGRPFAPPRRESAGRDRPSEGRGPGPNRKPARPFSPRSSGAKRR
ncbi:MAG: pseudouridine synthase [Nitrospinae bacterium]|nr:pseudouridine synthase [Nitrospinota bacterium]